LPAESLMNLRSNIQTLLQLWRHINNDQANASIIANNRVVFNILGNEYRLVAAVDYQRLILFIKFLGTHEEYDKIDATTIQYKE
jgi:mRNA interferase HigB